MLTRREFLLGAAALPLAARARAGKTAPLVVGGLPVTCNLTLPIACAAREKSGKGRPFEYGKYNGWPEIKESLMAGRIQAAYMLAPLVMDLADKRIPVKIVSLGHRSGAVIMVRKDSSYRRFKDLASRRIAIPSRFAVDYLFLLRMLKKEGMTAKDIEIVEMPPPDMPAALYAKAVDAYCTGEPFGAAAQRAGYAIPLRLTRDEWPKYICCVLTVREELIAADRTAVQELVDLVQGAGVWLDKERRNRDTAAELAAQRRYFNQDKNVIKFVMDNPHDRVTYGDLRMVRTEFEDLMRQSMAAATLKRAVPYEAYVDESFARSARAASIAL